jgi:hypothetical protein
MKLLITTSLIAICATFVTGCATYHQSAHEGWTQWKKSSGGNGHWYKGVAITNGISWAEADRGARAHGGYLATITSEAENQFVFSIISSPECWRGGSGPVFGGVQQKGAKEPDGGWAWVTGESWSYANWFPGTPDNWWGGPDAPSPEDRLHFYSGHHGPPAKPAPTWNDITIIDASPGGYIIEKGR